MSNRRRRRPPATVRTFARSYRCLDCAADIGRPWLDELGVWHLPVRHDDTCPTLTGAVTHTTAGLTAAAAVARAGARVAYLEVGKEA